MDRLQPSLRLLHCQTQAHVSCEIGPGFVAMCSACGLSLSQTHSHRVKQNGSWACKLDAHCIRKPKKHIHTQTSRFPRVAAAVGVIPSDNSNLTPLGGPSSFIYWAHQKRHTGHPLAAGHGARTRYLLCNATT